jgi:predicted nucleic acid-binding protein
MKLVVDACVFAAYQLEEQAVHLKAREFFNLCVELRVSLYAPAIVLPEVAAVVARVRGDGHLGELAPLKVLRGHELRLRGIDESFAWRAGRLAARCGLGGADALYAALAREMRIELVTDDAGLLALSTQVAKVISPAEWVRRQTSRRAR